MAEDELSKYSLISREIDELYNAITALSKNPVATRALLSAVEERFSDCEFELQKFVESHSKQS